MKKTYYFSHDFNARNDPKLQKVLMKLGQAGKGVFWDLIEMMYEQGGFLFLKCVDEYAFALRTTCDCINSLIDDFKLFIKDEIKFWSESVIKRIEISNEKSKKSSESAHKRWDAIKQSDANALKSDANALGDLCEPNAIYNIKVNDIKEKEILVKENIGDKSPVTKQIKAKNVFKPPTIEEIKGYIHEKQLKANPDRFLNYYESNGWRVGKNPMKDWKATIRNWRPDDTAQVMNVNNFKTKADRSQDAMNEALKLYKEKIENVRDVDVQIEKLPAEASN